MSGGGDKPLKCDSRADCGEPVTHIDEKGFIYCAEHGAKRKDWCRCRRLMVGELRQLRAGQPLASYSRPRSQRQELLDALRECSDVLHKLAQSMRIEGRTEHEKYAMHGAECARSALERAGAR